MADDERITHDDSALFREYARTRDARLREQLITHYVGLVSFLARRFGATDEQLDDVMQVGFIGLIKAIDRYDPNRGVTFTSYAVPTIVGEIRHYYRDLEQSVPLPRRLHELRQRAAEEVARLTQQLKREPSDVEVAAALDTTPEDVAAARQSAPLSLDDDHLGDKPPLSVNLPSSSDDIARSEDRATISQILARLSPRERIVLYLRFYQGLSQTEVAERLGISQMHVSRLQHRSLEKIKRSIEM